MSAFLCSARHISVIANADMRIRYCTLPQRFAPELLGDATDELHERVFMTLLAANVESLQARYPDSPDMWEGAELYRHSITAALPDVIGAIKLIDSYQYQSCEHEGWQGSVAQKYTDTLRHQLTQVLSGYDSAPWSLDDPTTVEG